MMFLPSVEQQLAIDHKGNCVITARPGSGKTFTVVQKMLSAEKECLDYQGLIAISFTNKASNELKSRCKAKGFCNSNSYFGTIDSFCLREIIYPFAAHYDSSIADISVVEEYPDDSDLRLLEEPQALPSEKEADLVLSALIRGEISLKSIGRVASFILNAVPGSKRYLQAKYTHIYIDEYQDCGMYQHLIFTLLVRELGLSGTAVGDIDQAIYGFAGKSERYLMELARADDFEHFEITQNHRCHRAISQYSLKYLGFPAEELLSNERRVFEISLQGDEEEIAKAISEHIEGICSYFDVGERREVAVLASANKTLDRISSNLSIPYRRQAETILDKGYSKWRALFCDLLRLLLSPNPFPAEFVNDYYGFEPCRQRTALLQKIEALTQIRPGQYSENIGLFKEIAMICVPDDDDAAALDSLLSVVSDQTLLREAYGPAKPDEINLMTYHKSKGLEFDVVICLETYEYVIPRYNSTAEEERQAINMLYVGVTRAKKACLILLGTSRHNASGDKKPAKPSPLLTRNGVNTLSAKGKW